MDEALPKSPTAMRLQAFLHQLPPPKQLPSALSMASGLDELLLQYITIERHAAEQMVPREVLGSCPHSLGHIHPAKVNADCKHHSWTSSMSLS